MAQASGTDPAGFDSQLATTHLFATAAEAFTFMTGETLPKTMDLVRRFSFDHGLLGQGAASPDVVGIQFPGGKVLGDAGGTKMRFDARYTQMDRDGQL
jgi:NitT/TauT family transport system substrate-binding protein